MLVWAFLVLLIGGAAVIASYVLKLGNSGISYFNHPMWLGLPNPAINWLVLFQVFAAIGFLTSAITWVFWGGPSGGFLSKPVILELVLFGFFVGAITWPFARTSILSALSLIITAVFSILLLSGSASETNPRWWVVLGWTLLCATTVLGDSVTWISRLCAVGMPR